MCKKEAQRSKIYYYVEKEEPTMAGLIMIFFFVVLMAIPGFYIITRKLFPKTSKRLSSWVTIILTAILVIILAAITLGNWPA